VHAIHLLVQPPSARSFGVFKSFQRKTYRFTKKLVIDKNFSLREFRHGTEPLFLRIFCSEDISEGVVISADGCGCSSSQSYAESAEMKMDALRYGESGGFKEGVGGGIIEIVSLKCVRNRGSVSARGVGGGKGGAIWIWCKHFANEHRSVIGCDDGAVQIRCETHSIAPLSIAPTPRIEIEKGPALTADFKRILGPRRSLPLCVAAHRGHSGSAHPKHLLANDTKDHYQSKWRVTNGDWMVFGVTDDTHFVIAQIKIRNNGGSTDYGIKKIALSLGDRESLRTDRWTEWKRIADIHNDDYEEMQCFDVEPDLEQRAFEFIKLEIKKNHGNKYQNLFYHFSLFGFEWV